MYKNRYGIEVPVKFTLKDKEVEGVTGVDNIRELIHLKNGEYDSLSIKVGNNLYLVPKEKIIKIEGVSNG